jgi:hypothetical protein
MLCVPELKTLRESDTESPWQTGSIPLKVRVKVRYFVRPRDKIGFDVQEVPSTLQRRVIKRMGISRLRTVLTRSTMIGTVLAVFNCIMTHFRWTLSGEVDWL